MVNGTFFEEAVSSFGIESLRRYFSRPIEVHGETEEKMRELMATVLFYNCQDCVVYREVEINGKKEKVYCFTFPYTARNYSLLVP